MTDYLRSLLLFVAAVLCLSSQTPCRAQIPGKADIYSASSSLTGALVSIQRNYVDTVDLDLLSEAAIRAMLQKLDPHSTYLTPKEVNEMNENLGGEFEGIGVRYQMEQDTLLVISTVAGGPSEKVGILPGDRIVMVGDSSIAGQHYSTEQIQRRLRGPKGSVVQLGVMRQAEPQMLWFKVERAKIPVISVDAAYMLTPQIGYIRVIRFAQTTPQEMRQALEGLQKRGMERLIIDLQDNGGGYLNSAIDLSNMFLPESEMVVYTEGRRVGRQDYITRRFSHWFRGPLVVLINEQSASASEIFAGCVQDLDRGVIVGRRSFGKGLVQRPVPLPNGGLMRLTTSHYFTPSGRCIQKPYTKGDQQSYQRELIDRSNHGELFSADSIHFADSLRHFTRAGRTVFGGGGIMPDVFVPVDTTLYTRAHRAVVARGSINRFVLQYFRDHQAELHAHYPTIDDFLHPQHGFQVDSTLIDGVLLQARQDSVQCDTLESLCHNDYFRLNILAYIANDLYEDGAMVRIFNRSSNILQKALAIITDDEEYRRHLQP